MKPARPAWASEPLWATTGARALNESYWFDAAAADRAIRWIESFCVHTLGEWAGRPFTLSRWQRRVVRKVFGWKRADGTRRYRVVFIGLPRKNGKTTFAAALALYLTIADGEPAAFVYAIAGNEDQARLVWGEAKRMALRSPGIEAIVEPLADALYVGETHSSFRPLSGKAATKHGLNPHGVVGDELHVWTDREQYDVMRSAVGSRRQPLEIYITTAGHDRSSVCWEMWQRAERVARREIDQPEFLSVIYAAASDDDWRKEATWRKANPGYGVSIKPDFLREQCEAAKDSPALENTFRQLHLNQWTEQAVRLISIAKWDACRIDGFDAPATRAALWAQLKGAKCFAGLDLALVTDLTALCLWFPPPSPLSQDRLVALWRYWCPEDNIRTRAKRDRVPYDVWARAGLLTATPGEATDLEAVRRDIGAIAGHVSLQALGCDPMFAHDMVQQLAGEGVNCQMVRQGMLTLAQPTAEFVRRIIKGAVAHTGDPVTRWMVGNVAAFHDAAGNFKPDKKKSAERIDGVSAAVTGLALVIDQEQQRAPSVYETRGVRTV